MAHQCATCLRTGRLTVSAHLCEERLNDGSQPQYFKMDTFQQKIDRTL